MVAIVGLYVSRRDARERICEISKALEALTKIAGSLRIQVDATQRQNEQLMTQAQRQSAAAERNVALKEQELNWNILAGVGKFLGWLKDQADAEEADS